MSPPEPDAPDKVISEQAASVPARVSPGRAFLLGLTGGALIVGAGTLLAALVGGPETATGVWVLWLTAPSSAAVAAGTTARLCGSSARWAVGLAVVALLGGVFLSGMADYGTMVAAMTSPGDPVSLLWRRFLGIAALSVFFAATLGLLFGQRRTTRRFFRTI